MYTREIFNLGRQWAGAERRMNVAALDTILADNFVAVDQHGSVLSRQQWLDRYRSGALKNERFGWQKTSLREYGGAAIMVGLQTQQATWQGQDSSGRFRVTQVYIRQADRWVIASIHVSGPIPGWSSTEGSRDIIPKG